MALIRKSPSKRANSTFAASTASVTMTLPTYKIGDILVLCIESANEGIPTQNQTNLTNNGWARAAQSNTVYGTAAGDSGMALDIWWQRATTESQTAVVLGDAGNHTQAVCMSVVDCISSGDPWCATINLIQTSAVSQVTFLNVTTTEANCYVLGIIMRPQDVASGVINTSPVLIDSSDDTGLTELFDFGTTSGNGGTISCLGWRKPTAGPTANLRANTLTSNTAIMWTGALMGRPIFPTSQTIII